MDAADVAVVGAGMAGLSCARALTASGMRVRVFEREPVAGGRIATRTENGGTVDLGAQYFTARDPLFIREVEDWCEAGVVHAWAGRIRIVRAGRVAALPDETTRYIAVPTMQMLPRALSMDLDVATVSPVAALERGPQGWLLHAPDGRLLGTARRVVLALPPALALPLVTGVPAVHSALCAATMAPTWCVVAWFRDPLDLAFDGAFVESSPLAWIARNNSKAERARTECWVMHAHHDWSAQRHAHPADTVIDSMLRAFAQATGCATRPRSASAHFWPHAAPLVAPGRGFIADDAAGLLACGDWCLGGRVEGAFLSGQAAARVLTGSPWMR